MRLPFDAAGPRARRAPDPLAVEHQRHVVSVRKRSRRTKQRNHQSTLCHGPKFVASMRQPQPARAT
nr:hypothetical protein [Microvirga massiliensis]